MDSNDEDIKSRAASVWPGLTGRGKGHVRKERGERREPLRAANRTVHHTDARSVAVLCGRYDPESHRHFTHAANSLKDPAQTPATDTRHTTPRITLSRARLAPKRVPFLVKLRSWADRVGTAT